MVQLPWFPHFPRGRGPHPEIRGQGAHYLIQIYFPHSEAFHGPPPPHTAHPDPQCAIPVLACVQHGTCRLQESAIKSGQRAYGAPCLPTRLSTHIHHTVHSAPSTSRHGFSATGLPRSVPPPNTLSYPASASQKVLQNICCVSFIYAQGLVAAGHEN